MNAFYIDSSVLLRIVLDQPGVLQAAVGADTRITSTLTEVECLRAVDASRFLNKLDDDQYADRRAAAFSQMRRIRQIALSPLVLRRAGEPLPAPLKTLDSIHVATALQVRERLHPDLVFATHDRQQGRVARLLDFEVIGL